MCTSGCGTMTAITFSLSKSARESRMYSMFQNTSPSLLTAITMFSGLVTVTTLRSSGSLTGICWTTTGIVIRKMMSSTSITSTRGVVLMAAITSCSWFSTSWPTVMAITGLLAGGGDGARGGLLRVAAHEDHVQVRREGAQVLHRNLVAAHEPVVAEHRGNRDREADGRHDQRLAHRARDLVDRGLAGDADGRQRVIDAPHRAEEADEGRGGAYGGEEREAVLEARGNVVHGALDRHRDPGVEVDRLQQLALVMRRRLDSA